MKVINGILVGAAIGAGLALLFAPSSGDKTRKFLTKGSKKYSRQALEAVSAYIDDLKKNYNEKVESIAEDGKSSIDSLKETVKAKSTS
jgi:gas vesicle protein